MSHAHTLQIRRRTALGLALPAALGVTMAVTATEANASPGVPRSPDAPEGSFDVTAVLSHHGQVEMTWPEQSDDVVAFTVHRGDAGQSWSPSADNLLATVGVADMMEVPLQLGFADFSVAANASYEYEVLALDAAGQVVARSTTLSITTGEISRDQLVTVLYAYESGHQRTEVRWKLPAADGSASVRLYSHPKPVTNPNQWKLLGTYDAADGRVTLTRGMATRSRHLRIVSDEGTEMTAAVIAADRAPLMVAPERLATIRREIAVEGSTLARTWAEMVADVEDGSRWIYPGAADRRIDSGRASYAGLAYLVTGEQHYADLAYEQFMVASERFNDDQPSQPLFSGALSTELALAYDWAREAWTAEQQQVARTVLLRVAAYWTITHYINDVPVRSSNWVGITRGGEAILRLALLGDPEYVDDTARFARVVDELCGHIDCYGSGGYTQEGLAYFIYGMREVVPAVGVLDLAGINVAKASLDRHDWVSFIGHSQAFGLAGYRLFMGVDTGRSSSHQYAGEFVAEGLVLARDSERGAMRWLYDHISGNDSVLQTFGNSLGRDLTLLFYPVDVAPVDPDEVRSLAAAQLDEEEGAFLFRNRYQDVDDALVGMFTRGKQQQGWSAMETFGLSLMSHDTQWTVMPGKAVNFQRTSKPLVDGDLEPEVGYSRTLAAEAYAGQGGGYVEVDASGNYQVEVAHRSMVVDTSTRGNVVTTVAIHDSFADDVDHTWTWQLGTVRPIKLPDENGLGAFVVRQNGAWLKGWVVPEDGVPLSTESQRVVKAVATGAAAEFRVLLAMGVGTEPTAAREGNTITLEGVTYDLDDLASFRP